MFSNTLVKCSWTYW